MNVYDLWLPIVLSGIATHVLSTMAWMALPHHKPEWNPLPSEDEFQDWILSHKIPAKQYIFPLPTLPDEMKSDAFRAKQAKCTGMLILWERVPNMVTAILKTVTFFMVAAFVIGYLASLALPAGASFSRVIQFVVTAGLLTHCAAHFPHVFWFRRRIAMEIVDGVVYAVVTGLIFAYFWPAA